MTTLIYLCLLIAAYLTVIGFFLSNIYLAARSVSFFPFAMFWLAFMFLLFFVSNDASIIKWVSGIMILICGLTCTIDIKSIRKKLGREEYL